MRVTARGADEKEAAALRDGLVQRFRDRLGDLIYSEESEGLENVVVPLLAGKRQRLATAESCTGLAAGPANHQRGRRLPRCSTSAR